MDTAVPDHYATLGVGRRCTEAQIRAAYRLLSKQHHPDRNPGSAEAVIRAQELNAAHEVLSDPEQRRAYDRELHACSAGVGATSLGRLQRNVSQDVHLRIEEFFRGASLEVCVKDPANPHGSETYQLHVEPETAPGTRFRLPRAAPFEGGFVQLRLRALPSFRFKVRGSDLRCDLRISSQRAERGGVETIVSPAGTPLRIEIPAGVGRGEILRVRGEGLPKARHGRGDLLVRVTYRVEVRSTRKSR